MKWTPLLGLGLAATAYADNGGVTGNIAPKGNPPAGCNTSFDGKFQVTIGKLGKRAIQKRSCDNPDALLLTLENGVLKDAKGRTGYIASNYQFQFDGPPQAGAIYTAGFSVCANDQLALGPSTTFYECLSGSFYNLYDRNWAPQCEAINIIALPCDARNGGGNGGNGGGHNTVGTQVVQTTVVTVISDGQPQVHTTTVGIPMCQIGDGQVQAHTTPCNSIPPGPPPVTQISDGQPQAPSNPPPVTQISDGQPQAPPNTAQPPPVITQISDGQPQAPTNTAQSSPPVITQISDGQPQAPTGAPAPSGSPQPSVSAPVGTGTGVVPPVPSAPTQVPVNSGSKALPGITAALALALAGVLAL